jgi:hypothetical protein
MGAGRSEQAQGGNAGCDDDECWRSDHERPSSAYPADCRECAASRNRKKDVQPHGPRTKSRVSIGINRTLIWNNKSRWLSF